MREAELNEIRDLAKKCHKDGVKWHFHLLTPSCNLNEQQRYAFIIECPSQNQVLVHYSDQAERGLGEELSPLLHGAKVLEKESSSTTQSRSKIFTKIVDRAKALNNKGIEWHHHVLFPDCKFNKKAPKYTFMFEDPETHKTFESITAAEPKDDIKQIELLFYKK